jgi:hypothetical protein
MENRIKKQWSFIGAGLIGLCILFFVFLKTFILPPTTQLDRAIVSREQKPSASTAQKKSPEPPQGVVGLPKDKEPLNSGQALNRTESGPEDKEKLSHKGAASSSRPDHLREEKEPRENKLPLGKKKQASLIKFVGAEQEGRRELDLPIGTVISQGNVKMEVRDKVWRTLESSYSPILKGKKIRIENGTARMSLSNNSLIEAGPNCLLSFEDESQLNLLGGGIHFRIPATAQMNFRIGALSVRKPHRLTSQKGLTTALIREEGSEGFLFLHPDGSLKVRSVQGSLSILDHENRALTTLSSDESITIPAKILSGKEPWRAEQRSGVPGPKVEEKLLAPIGKERSEVDELEKYLIEFSVHLKGKDLPVDLDAQQFFSILEAGYPYRDRIEKVKQYPVKVRRKGESYILTLCDKQSEWMLYKDLGETTHMVDNIYDPEERTVRCREAPSPYWLLTVPAAAVATGVVVYEVDRHNDHKDRTPLCP